MSVKLNPSSYKIACPNDFSAKSVMLLSTPLLLPQVIDQALLLNQEKDIQVVVAGVDRMVPNGASLGISELWLKDLISIDHSELLKEEENPPRESDGVHAVKIDKNWKMVDSSLQVNFCPNLSVNLKLANTIFTTLKPVTMFFLQDSSVAHADSGQTLRELAISLPIDEMPLKRVEHEDKWIPLHESEEEELIITSSAGNLLKQINDEPASRFLQENEKLMSRINKEAEVYVKLIKKETGKVERHRVVAGGGEWGAKANILAISPEAHPRKGDRIEFFMLDPESCNHDSQNDKKSWNNVMVFECSSPDTVYPSTIPGDFHMYNNVFGCATEGGYSINGIQYRSAGDRSLIYL